MTKTLSEFLQILVQLVIFYLQPVYNNAKIVLKRNKEWCFQWNLKLRQGLFQQ